MMIFSNLPLYDRYPEFQQKVRELLQAQAQEVEVMEAQMQMLIDTIPHDTFVGRLHESRYIIDAKYSTQIWQAHADYGVPHLGPWDYCLAQTGRARYHDPAPDEHRRCQATLERKEDHIVLTLQTTVTFLADRLHNHIDILLVSAHMRTDAWEALPVDGAEQQQKGEGEHNAQ